MYSFDIFDTLITRDVASPKGIFACMQEVLQRGAAVNIGECVPENGILLPSYVRDNFCQLRIHAEEIARETYRKKGYEDILLTRIYEAFTLLGELDEGQIAWLMELENQTEVEHAVGIRENILYLRGLLDRGEKVVLVSDMYLEEKVIREMLLRTDPIFAGIPVYVSAEWNRTKYSGSLYDLVRERELPEGQEWIHLGDNTFSDEKQAIAKGVRGQLYTGEGLTVWERRVMDRHPYHEGIQKRIGVSRLARRKLVESGNMSRLTDAHRIGSSIGGNVLVPYIYWVLQVSKERGFSRLYFIARDGYLLKKVADELISRYRLDIRTKYIYGSRKAWRVPAVGYFGKDYHEIYRLVYWSHPRTMDSVGKLAEIFGLTEDELYPFLPEGCRHGGLNEDGHGGSGDDRQERMKFNERFVRELALMLDQDEGFRKYVAEKNLPKRQLLQEYLLQELDLSDENFAFVDLSGGGFSQECLAQVMKDLTDVPVRFFYFRLNQMNPTDNCISYVFVPGKLVGSLIVEMMCRAPHGQTEGYRRGDGGNCVTSGSRVITDTEELASGSRDITVVEEPGSGNRVITDTEELESGSGDLPDAEGAEIRIYPVLGDEEQEALLAHGYMDFAAGVLAYAEEYGRIAPDLDGGNDLTLLLHYMKEIVENPDREVLEFFAGMPNNVTGRENKVIEYAPHLSKDELMGIYLLRRADETLEKYYPYSSLEYSLLRCTEEEKAYIAYCKAHYEDEVWRKEREKRLPVGGKYGRAACFPCELLEERVVLYGAGKYGCDIYEKIWDWPYGEVVLWVDRKVRRREFRGVSVDVMPPEDIEGVDSLQIVIAVADKRAADEIRRELKGKGIDTKKLLWWPIHPVGVEWEV